MKLYSQPFNFLAIAAVLGLWIVGALLHTNWTLAVGMALFAVWDIYFLSSENAFDGRDKDNILRQTETARAQISYFLPFYGVLFGILFTLNAEEREQIQSMITSAGIPLWMLVSPLLLAAAGMLFFPIQVARKSREGPWDDPGEEVTQAMKALLAFTVFFQKASIFLLVHVILRIAVEL